METEKTYDCPACSGKGKAISGRVCPACQGKCQVDRAECEKIRAIMKSVKSNPAGK